MFVNLKLIKCDTDDGEYMIVNVCISCLSQLNTRSYMNSLGQVSTLENKNRITCTFSILYLSTSVTVPDQKKGKTLQLRLYHPSCRSQVETGTENWYRKPMHGFNFVFGSGLTSQYCPNFT